MLADERRIVDELEDKAVIRGRRMAQNQPFGFEHFRHSDLRLRVDDTPHASMPLAQSSIEQT
jgi:hypothetical protein